jgi:apolipoprotein N-acyltransferase
MINRGSGFGVRGSLAALSAIFLILSFPPFNIWLLAWVAFVPLFFAIEGSKPSKAFLVSYLAGFLFFLGTIYWLIHVTLPGMLIVVMYLALYFGLFGLVINFGSRFHTPGILFFIPAAWVSLELIRGHVLTGFGWNLLGYSQSFNLPIIQIADVSGVYGVSFLIVMFNAALFMFIKNFRKKEDFYIPLAMSIILIFFVLGYGYYRLNSTFTGEKIKVAIIQGNIPQDEKWDRSFTEMILSRYETLTKEAAKGGVDLVIWPETSVPGFLESEKDLLSRVTNVAVDVKAPLLVGAPRYEENKEGAAYFNSSYLVLKDGSIKSHYDKIHLVPFGEYLPFKNALSFVHKFARRPIGDFTAGKEFTVSRFFIRRSSSEGNYTFSMLKNVGFSTLICFEDIFPDLTREFVQKGTDFLVNITNDGWFGHSAAAYQHAQNSVFRAVENRINVIRAANIGLSCFIDQKGRITAKVADGNKDLFVEGYKVQEIVLSRAKTLYNVYGDVFAFLCIFFTVLTMMRSLRERKS